MYTKKSIALPFFLRKVDNMPKFFIDFGADSPDSRIEITGSDALHISKTLRMKVGEKLTVTDSSGTDYFTVIEDVAKESIILRIESKRKSDAESVKEVFLFQALIKNEKMDTVIQKAVELGANHIYPVSAERSIVKLDSESGKKKLERWNKIAKEASKQCGRGIIPTVHEVVSIKEASEIMSELDKSFYCYEISNGRTVKDVLKEEDFRSVGFYIGPEGGIAPSEAETFDAVGIPSVSLGKLILRTETAGMAVLSMILYETRL